MAVRTYKIQLFLDVAGMWRYRLRAPNGQVMQSGEAYVSAGNARRAANRFARLLSVPVTIDVLKD